MTTKNKRKIGLILILVLIVAVILIRNRAKRQCGDGICQKQEEEKNNTSFEGKPAICGNGVCKEGETGSNCRDCGNFAVKSVKTLIENAGRADWAQDGQWVAFDRKGSDGYYDIWTMKINGTEEKCLTCNNKTLAKNNGNPSWDPSGRFIVFQGQDARLKYPTIKLKIAGNFLATPGGGLNNNIWAMDRDGKNFWQLTYISDGMATLHPHFSESGTKLAWTEKTSLKSKGGLQNQNYDGEWEIAISKFSLAGDIPQISNTKYYKPGDFQQYELGNFSPDEKFLLFTFWKRDDNYQKMDIGRMNIETGSYETLIKSADWDEFPTYSPDGKYIVWLSSTGVDQPNGGRLSDGSINPQNHYMDYWIMNADGSNKYRLTYLNSPSALEYVKGGTNPADVGWKYDGKALLAKIRKPGSSVSEGEKLIIINF